MSENWQIGDLAVCVDDRPSPRFVATGLAAGRHYRVTGVKVGTDNSGRVDPALLIDGAQTNAPDGFAAHRFRKIRPDAHEGSADDWALILETTKRRAAA